LHYAIDHGVDYVDTAYTYHGGEGEPFVGRALLGGYRSRVRLATKLPCWQVHASQDFDRYLNEQLARLQTDHIDFYLLHSLRSETWHRVHRLGVLDWAAHALKDGRIGYLGFSFHDQFPVFKEIVDAYDWTFCQIQYNYMDVDNQAGTRGLRYAASRGLAVVIMEPLLGGKLASPPTHIEELWNTSRVARSPVEWALQWLWNQPEVSVVLSGMSAMRHVEENVRSADASGVGTLTGRDLALVDRVRAAYRGGQAIPCTDCGYCMPCPNGVNIPRNLAIYNDLVMYEEVHEVCRSYSVLPEAERASACVQCGACEELCPQSIAISAWMPRIDEALKEAAQRAGAEVTTASRAR
jgi:predicted aldo/keto reductase-like oxidoreductase